MFHFFLLIKIVSFLANFSLDYVTFQYLCFNHETIQLEAISRTIDLIMPMTMVDFHENKNFNLKFR
ncbi:CLUMA_CG020332, isoform A [Clunio marinus]|uniref:CLUMA_CG020332, isoform A n=1 Tax=Clunio marinus TaxID=568069 RepID=A0A1J1J5T5_9DIPT|nr:CLUMA_CG020332, isoform A [Clunio marinus]